jgi:double-GTPase-like protein
MDEILPLIVLAAVAALELALVFVAFWLLWVVVPLALVAFVATFLGTYLHQVRQTLVTSPPTARHQPPREPAAGEQPAYRQYFSSQGWADLEQSVGGAASRCQALTAELANRLVKSCFHGDAVLVAWPFGVVGLAGVVVGAMGGAAALLLAVAVHAVLAGIAHVICWCGIALLRLIDTALLRLRGIRITCGACHHRVPYPAYECPSDGCSLRHTDVRPGRYGVFRRVCACGAAMPTLLILGSHRMRAFCVYCGEPLVTGTGTASEVMLPLFGATTAGKTRLMLTLVRAVSDLSAAAGGRFEFADGETDQRYRELLPALEPGRQTRQTVVGQMPRAYSMYVAPPAGARHLVHVFDVAGERFARRQGTEELRYLSLAGLYLFVLDPLSIEPFWRHLPEGHRARLASFRAVQPPEELFVQTCEQMQMMGARTRRGRLAVALSKHDLVCHLPPFAGAGNDSPALERCLVRDLELGNLVRTMRREFREVRFFATAAVLDRDGRVDASVVALGRWLLDGEGLPMRETA